jgi:hypothetical protein
MAQKNILLDEKYNFSVIFKDTASSIPTFSLRTLLLRAFALGFCSFLFNFA